MEKPVRKRTVWRLGDRTDADAIAHAVEHQETLSPEQEGGLIAALSRAYAKLVEIHKDPEAVLVNPNKTTERPPKFSYGHSRGVSDTSAMCKGSGYD